MYCDLHTHSNFSDGTDTPMQLVTLAKQSNRIIALTDHNTVAGLPAFMAQAEEMGVTAVGGIELSTEYEGKELHLLGLFIEQPHYETIQRWTDEFRSQKERSNRQLCERLCADGYCVDYSRIVAENGQNVNRAYIANALCRDGYVTSVSQAFHTLLDESHGYYIPPKRPSVWNGLDVLQRIKAVPVLAHPLKDLDEQSLCRLLDTIVPQGLAGMEIYHSSYNQEQSNTAAKIAKAYALLPGGGSDYHGTRKEHTPFGIPEIPRQVYDDLLCYKKSIL